jgi:hypothetical protein
MAGSAHFGLDAQVAELIETVWKCERRWRLEDRIEAAIRFGTKKGVSRSNSSIPPESNQLERSSTPGVGKPSDWANHSVDSRLEARMGLPLLWRWRWALPMRTQSSVTDRRRLQELRSRTKQIRSMLPGRSSSPLPAPEVAGTFLGGYASGRLCWNH